MTIDEKVVEMEVIGKREGTRGLIFKKPEYVVALQLTDKSATINPTQERRVPFHQYCSVNVGDKMEVYLYSSDQEMWFFSEEEAKLYQERK
ncbi:MAG: hypothetical protein PVJ67_07125 [Candidatus Pacearchaeota archaeon]|jgi:hypothetical protein